MDPLLRVFTMWENEYDNRAICTIAEMFVCGLIIPRKYTYETSTVYVSTFIVYLGQQLDLDCLYRLI